MDLSRPSRSLVWDPAVDHASGELPLASGMASGTEASPPSSSGTTVTTAMASSAWMSAPASGDLSTQGAAVDRAALRAEFRELRRLELARQGRWAELD